MAAEHMRIVLAADADLNDLGPTAYKKHWWIQHLYQRTDDRPKETVFVTRDHVTAIHWIEDHRLGVKYVRQQASTLVERLDGLRTPTVN